MAKRYTDTDKWKKPFIRGMKASYKLLWLYILDECDHAGIWQVDLEVAQIKIGEKFKLETALQQLAGKIYVFDGGEKWYIPDFIEFQYGELNPENRVHKSVLDLLTKYSLLDIKSVLLKTHTSPLEGAMDMDKDKDKEKDKEAKNQIPEFPEFEAYAVMHKPRIDRAALKLKYKSWVENKWHNGHGKPIKNWKSNILNTLQHIPETEKTW